MRESGTIVAQRFRLLEKLGEGGMGVTWKALDVFDKREVAIKFLRIAEAKDWKSVELFEREIRVLRSLDHPQIPDLIEGNADTSGDWFLVQELAPGQSIQGLCERGERFDEVLLRTVAEQVLEILEYLQSRSPPIVHRDIKPDNLIINTDGQVKLVDFGAASLAITDRKLGGSTVVGTFGFMAPEQFRGVSLPATDLYGLGMTLIVMATGRPPEQLETSGLKVQFAELVQLSPAFVNWLNTMVEPDADHRFADARTALESLRRLDDEPGESPSLTPADPQYRRRLQDFSTLRFASLKKEVTASGINLIYKRKGTIGLKVAFTAVGLAMALATVVTVFFEPFLALFFSLFAIVFGGVGINEILFRERLRFQNDGQWSWTKRGIFGTRVAVGSTRDIVRFEAGPSNIRVNNRRLYQVVMSSYHGDYPLFTGLSYGESLGLARELSTLTGAEDYRHETDVGVHMARAFDAALQKASQRGGVLGGLARAARQSPAIKRSLLEAGRVPELDGRTPDGAHPQRSSRSAGALENAEAAPGESLVYEFDPSDYDER